MHELSVCQAVVRQVLDFVAPPDATAVGRITRRIGPLAGVEPDQLRRAFPMVAAGTSCEGAILEIHPIAVEIWCRLCGQTSHPRANRLLCAACGTWQVRMDGWAPRHMAVLGIQPCRIDWDAQLSETVTGALPAACRLAIDTVQRWR
jgi:hydrogenase nickel incorporation protein HypA/HybF